MITNKVIYNSQQQGSGWLIRDFGKYPPKMRKQLELYGDEKITDIELFRYPLKELGLLAKLASLGRTPYDELFHLGMRINGKYTLDKDAVLNFVKEPNPASGKQNAEYRKLGKPPNDMTINELLDKTQKRVGKVRFYKYSALKNNCQRFVADLLNTLGLKGNDKWVLQHLDEVKKVLPSFTEPLAGVINTGKEILDRFLYGEGKNKQCKILF